MANRRRDDGWRELDSAPLREAVLVEDAQGKIVVARRGKKLWFTIPGKWTVKPLRWMPLPAMHNLNIPCGWQNDQDGGWDTDCGNKFELFDGTPADNKMAFCPYCGRSLDERVIDHSQLPTQARVTAAMTR